MSVETPSPAIRRLHSVQAMRGAAALLVVLYHTAAHWRAISANDTRAGAWLWDQGFAGVDMFFVISGFVMVYTAGANPGGVGEAVRFLWRRVGRIYPLWWVFCALLGAIFLLIYGQPAQPDMAQGADAWRFFAGSLLLWPQGQAPVLNVGWTLVFEMGFYTVFAGLLLLPSRLRPWCLMVWAAAVLLAVALLPYGAVPGDPLRLLVHPLVLEFLLGAGVAYALSRQGWSQSWGRPLAAFGVAAFVASMAVGLDVDSPAFEVWRVATYGLASALLLAGLVRWEAEGLGVPRWAKALGDQSYSLYLSHPIVLLLIRAVADEAVVWPGLGWLSTPSPWQMAVVMGGSLVACVVTGAGVHAALERPLLRAVRRPMLQGAPARAS